MTRVKITFMNNQIYANIKNRFGNVICHKCRTPLDKNQQFVRVGAAQRRPAKHYHIMCAKQVNLI